MRPILILPRGSGWVCRVRFALVALTVLSFLGMVAPASVLAQDAANPGKVITLGESLSDAQRQELLTFFESSPDDEVTTITEEQTKDAMDGIFDTSTINGAYSSTALTCQELGDGLDVTTRNITVQPAVTPAMFAMALVTAGIGDATLVVAAPNDAPARGLTALAGVFASWDIAPCQSGDTTKERQRLALEELTLTSAIGQKFVEEGDQDGVVRASVIVLETQKTIVIDGINRKNAIEGALTSQERAQGATIPAAERRQLVNLFVNLAGQNIDWSTFALGWNIAYPDGNHITMTGEGIAIRNAQASATAEAVAQMTATANALAATSAALTATADAMSANATADANNMTATASAHAQATADAIAAMTATAAAQPTATPLPTATPTPSTVTGVVVGTGGDEITIRRDGASSEPVTYKMDPKATVVRDGQPVILGKVVKGDAAMMIVNGGSRLVTDLTVVPAPVPLAERLRFLLYLLPIAVIVPLFLWLKGRKPPEPFIVKRVVA